MIQILVEAKNLICKDGKVWLWKSDNMDFVNFFATKDDAHRYIDLHHQFSREQGRKEVAYSIGTENDYLAAVKKYEADKKANEVNEYCKHVDSLIERRELEIKALDGLLTVCRQFDGKVLNKRFLDAVKDVTGFYSKFGEYFFELENYNIYYNNEYRPSIMISADWSHGKSSSSLDFQWQWNTGERLEAEKAFLVIDHCKNDRLKVVQELTETKKQYAAYLRLARKAEQIFKEMEGYSYTIREFAKEKALSQHSRHSYFWNGY